MIFEDLLAFKENGAFLPRRQIGFIIVTDDMHAPVDRAADRALVREPVLAGGKGHAIALRPRIIFEKHRSPPVEHPLLDRHRAWGRGVDRALPRRHLLLVEYRGGQYEHAAE